MDKIILRPSGPFKKEISKAIINRQEAEQLFNTYYEDATTLSIKYICSRTLERLLNNAIEHNCDIYFKFEIKE